ncbi:hypothetical protein K0M31_003286 [Melipona bicolor]|uniref:Uncharacterized protein n=1 Tax=Melipona bicolor TaxID=60889 RepID=A0AA40FZ88_9HYME|nr:hypothetical protein K0M31_003286 [Melipona bicolor]
MPTTKTQKFYLKQGIRGREIGKSLQQNIRTFEKNVNLQNCSKRITNWPLWPFPGGGSGVRKKYNSRALTRWKMVNRLAQLEKAN